MCRSIHLSTSRCSLIMTRSVSEQVPADLVQAVIDLSREFFSLPEENKHEISISRTDHARGYQKLGENVTQYQRDWHEGIDLYKEVDATHEVVRRGGPLSGANPWPASIPAFKPTFERYVDEMLKLGRSIMRGISVGLGLDEDALVDKYMSDSFWVMRAIGYPPLQSSSSTSENVGISCGEHTDYGALTIVNQDSTKGALQVLRRDGCWINADPIPNAFVVNIGDMLNHWTNDIYRSTCHRVIHKGDSYRVSVPFFFEPNWDAMVEPLEGLVGRSGQPAKYKPVKYGDHLMGKITTNFAKDDPTD
mmetsp:Transcript_14380/g.23749  ORF Transcript_14380/g.23749 Transcript_14380/m.23749 type:complete len:305 (-) Transcript_14380:479-1393(-)